MRTTSHRFRLLSLAALLYAIFPATWVARPFISQTHSSICIFHTLTGRPCLFCGLTRAFAHATHGYFNLAFSFHSLWFLAAFLIISIASISLLDAVKGTDFLRLFARLQRVPIWLIVVMLVVLTVLRLLWLDTPTLPK